jgi:hypothetical protein
LIFFEIIKIDFYRKNPINVKMYKMEHLTFRKATFDDLKINTRFKINSYITGEYYIATLRKIKYSRIKIVTNRLMYDLLLELDNVTFVHKNGSFQTLNLECFDYENFYIMESQKENIQNAMEHRAFIKIMRELVDENI